jgi:hypothetical protein
MQVALEGRTAVPFHPPPTTTTIATTTTSTPRSTTTSTPRPRVVVPDVLGDRVAIAVRDLQSLGFAVERIPTAKGTGPPGRVMGQSPSGGTLAPGGSTVRIEVPVG